MPGAFGDREIDDASTGIKGIVLVAMYEEDGSGDAADVLILWADASVELAMIDKVYDAGKIDSRSEDGSEETAGRAITP